MSRSTLGRRSENYSIRDPYSSLARSAMSEYAMFHRAREKMRADMAIESDPDRRRVIELRMGIEASDYMAITSDRLASISVAISGQPNTEQAIADRTQARAYRMTAAQLRAERSALIETIQDRVQVMTEGPDVAGPVRDVRPVSVTEQAAAPQQPKKTAGEASPGSQSDRTAPDARGPTATISPLLRRPDVIAPRQASSRVTLDKADPIPSLSTEQQSDRPWMESLRRRVEEAEAAPAGKEVSDSALAKLARRIEQGKNKTEDKGKTREKSEPDKGSEPELDL